MSLKAELNNELKEAMKSQDKTKLSVIRMLKSSLTNEEVNAGHELSNQEENGIVNREIKQHKESIEEFEKGKREDLVKQQESELAVLKGFAPKQMSEDAVKKIVSDNVEKLHAKGKNDFGKVMGAVVKEVGGKADGKLVNKLVNQALNG